ncbi:hypothetical protein SISNIDRAFT_146710 [Sistotremastrum niveocremeum HHB9708]|uniref:Uncharacterized protein n=1 Tax=Sistotremastrum niveocremeum HHB9708 TaxID=1314777 RepID=A0A165A5U4_9AGAM|nr:hypothetical protein SISNIDRAFT_146710 [Sistotremastrum niveocremeum HHB9708]
MASQRARKEVPSARPNHKITNFFPVKTPTSSQSSSSSQSAVKKTKSSEVKAGSQVEPPRVVESKTSSKTSQSFTSSFSSPPAAPLALPGSGSANAQPVRALEQSLSHSTAIKEPGLSSGTARPSKRTQSAMEEESHENSDDVIVRPSPPKQPRIDSSQSEVKATPTKKIQSKTSAANATNPPAVRRPLTPYHATSEPMAFIDPSIPHSTPLTGSEEIGQAETIASPRLLESKRSAIDAMQVDAVVPSSQEDEKEFSRVPAMTSRPKAMDDSFVINSPAPSTSSTTSSSTPEAHPIFSSGQASDRKSVSSAASSVPSLGAPSPLIDHHEHARRKIEEMKARISEKAKAAIKVENPSKTPNLEESSDEELLSPFEKNRDSNPQPALR